MPNGTGKGEIALQRNKAREGIASPRRIRHSKNWLQGSRFWAGNPALLLFFSSSKEEAAFFQLFFDVTAKKAAASW